MHPVVTQRPVVLEVALVSEDDGVATAPREADTPKELATFTASDDTSKTGTDAASKDKVTATKCPIRRPRSSKTRAPRTTTTPPSWLADSAPKASPLPTTTTLCPWKQPGNGTLVEAVDSVDVEDFGG